MIAPLFKRLLTGSQPAPFTDSWDFLSRAVWTKDEASGTIRQFPGNIIWEETGELQYGYLREIINIIEREQLIALDKCRRMMITWCIMSWLLYDTLTQPNHANFVVSKKLEDAAYLLGDERALGVYRRIPDDVWPNKPQLEWTGKDGMGYDLLSCPSTGSYIQAVAQGADQLRQFTASNVFFDEFAFQARQREAMTAAKPTIDGGGRIIVVSTPELGAYMYDWCYGEQ
jgi:hypothetical protein